MPTAPFAIATSITSTGAPGASLSAPTPFRFASTLYAYAATAPAGWMPVAGFLRWDGTGSPGHDAAEVDKLVGPDGIDGIMIFAFSAPTSKSLGAYQAEAIGAAAAAHGSCPIDSNESVTVDGGAALVARSFCGLLISLAVTVHHGVGYQFVFRDPAAGGSSDSNDARMFDDFLASVDLEP